ncbi:hypothetical protein EW026_g1486 [Hermanssonia centrifuga]|uniref:Uncharacterized protein n=1 Tax=Hermanssonia centrifuga TaxID=98765 RepID=A0A4S4KRB5_9APHY|nr:hypothetical protein EW026_g1486 [Hermanssonia centrifuga]
MTADSMERVATTAQNIKQFCLKLKFDFQINDKRYIEIEQQVKSQLPALTARGILHVTRG